MNQPNTLASEVSRWENKYPSLRKFFKSRVINGLLKIADLLSEKYSLDEKTIKDFVKGLFLLREALQTGNFKDREQDEEYYQLIEPILNLLKQESDIFVKAKIRNSISGQDVFHPDTDIDTILSHDLLFSFIKKEKELIISEEDVYRSLRNLKKKLRKVHSNEDNDQGIVRLSVPEIALLHVYLNKSITTDNMDKIAKSYGYTSKSSGRGLYEDYIYYLKPHNRRGEPESPTKKKFENKIQLLTKVMNLLPENLRKIPQQDIQILNKLIQNLKE